MMAMRVAVHRGTAAARRRAAVQIRMPLHGSVSVIPLQGLASCARYIGRAWFSNSTPFHENNNGVDALRIGHVVRERGPWPSDAPHLIPQGYVPPGLLGYDTGDIANTSNSNNMDAASRQMLHDLQWMLSKDSLGQDMLLIGAPGAAALYRRRLVLAYAELLRRPIHVLNLTADVTESDLKQRRELVGEGSKQDLVFVDQAPVQAARHGHLLLLEGLERAERNVLPTLNNLLEHRSMHLEDGRLLVPRHRMEQLRREQGDHLDNDMLVPVHDDFRVLATAVPVPPYGSAVGRRLDPPLRSRFQIKRVGPPWWTSAEDVYEQLLRHESHDENSNDDTQERWCSSLAAALVQQSSNASPTKELGDLWNFPITSLAPHILSTLKRFPQQDRRRVWERYFPVLGTKSDDNEEGGASGEFTPPSTPQAAASKRALDAACVSLDRKSSDSDGYYKLQSLQRDAEDTRLAHATFQWRTTDGKNDFTNGTEVVTIPVPCGSGPLAASDADANLRVHGGASAAFVSTQAWEHDILPAMMQEHGAGRDILLVSPPGQGKTAMALAFARTWLGYRPSEVHVVPVYQEMTGRDLFLRRAVDGDTGATGWDDAPLLHAAKTGGLCILDGVDKLRPDALASLVSFANDRDVWLPDGRRVAPAHHALEPSSGDEGKIIRVHPAFRVIALAGTNASTSTSSWLSDNILCSFSTLYLPRPSRSCMRSILKAVKHQECPDAVIEAVLDLRDMLTPDIAVDCGVAPLSTRNLIRVVRRCSNFAIMHRLLNSVLVSDLLPPTQRATLEALFQKAGVSVKSKKTAFPEGIATDGNSKEREEIVFDDEILSIGSDFSMERAVPQFPELVPAPNFFDIPSHVSMIKHLLEDWNSGERAFLLLGNQGVGKNMVADRLCQIARFEREYIQLHRDSTIAQLTLQPSLEDGKIVWKDSPLVRAVTHGLSLIVDEADKAPIEVLSVLKGLVEDGELLLGDGRRILRHDHESHSATIKMHPKFTLWVLANRPGFPFLGNDFFKHIGDVFLTRVVSNPDFDSELTLLSSYGPSVDKSLLRRIAGSFAELRSLSDHGDLSYPYSTREAVNVIKHMERFPQDGIIKALHNTLDWDSFDEHIYATLGRVFQRHGIPVEEYAAWQEALHSVPDSDLRIEFLDREGRVDNEGISNSPPPLSLPKEGRWDDKNEAHVGGNQWAGGTGGSDTAGLGGRGGPYRLDRGHKVHQVSDEAKAQVSKEAAEAARSMAQKALNEKLADINMSEEEWDMYKRFVDPIQSDIAKLRAILNQVDNQQSERGWIKRQSHGELDDAKLVDSVTGDKYVYKRRGTVQDAGPSQSPKRMCFVVDCSGSMYRFNSYDERLIRSLEATNLIMESFAGQEERFDICIVGHSGDSPCIPLVKFGQPPRNERERMKVLQTMVAHTQYCQSGDYTVEAVAQAVKDVRRQGAEADNDDAVVIAISDANLERYGIRPRELGRVMESEPHVKAYYIAIASFGREAEEIKQDLPIGRGHVCLQTSDLPRIVRNILTTHM